MDRFAYITDSHFKGKRVETRTDDYCASLFKKLDFVVAFCKKKKIVNVIHGGDLLDNPNISDLVAGKIAKVFSKNKLHLWYVIGNHDITGKNADTYVNGKLHMFESYDWFHFIGGRVAEFENCLLTGVDYSYEGENETHFRIKEFEKTKKARVLVLHSMIYGDEQDLMVGSKRIVTSYRNIDANADLVLTGHYHPGMKTKKLTILNNDIIFANPGSFGRTDSLTNRIGVGPGLTYIRIGENRSIKVRHVSIPCDRNVFVSGSEGKYELADIGGAKFFESLNKFKEFQVAKNDIGMMLKAMASVEGNALPFKIDDEMVAFIVGKVREIENGR